MTTRERFLALLHRLPRGFDALRIAIAGILFVAAGLKGYQLATQPAMGTGWFESRWFLIGVVEFELFFGLWLLSGILPAPFGRRAGGEGASLPSASGRRPCEHGARGGEGCTRSGFAGLADADGLTWRAALVCFSAFACVSLYKALSGYATCGCFGAVTVNPWYTTALDLAVVCALLYWRPLARASVNPNRIFAHVLHVGLLWLLIGMPATYAMGSFRPVALSETGDVLADGTTVVLNPQSWVGRRFPLLGYIDAGDRLNEGNWLVVLYHSSCPQCRDAIANVEALCEATGTARAALIEVPPCGAAQFAGRGNRYVQFDGRLDGWRNWFVQTPVILIVRAGFVRSCLVSASGDKAFGNGFVIPQPVLTPSAS